MSRRKSHVKNTGDTPAAKTHCQDVKSKAATRQSSRQKHRTTKTAPKGNFFDRAIAMSKKIQIHGLTEDFAEHLDDYLYRDLHSLQQERIP